MKTLLPNDLYDRVKTKFANDFEKIKDLLNYLSSASESELKANKNVRLMTADDPGLYLMRYADFRVFLSFINSNNERILLLVDVVYRDELFKSKVMYEVFEKAIGRK